MQKEITYSVAVSLESNCRYTWTPTHATPNLQMMMMKFSHENVISSFFHQIVFYGQNVSQNDSIDVRAHLYDAKSSFEKWQVGFKAIVCVRGAYTACQIEISDDNQNFT